MDNIKKRLKEVTIEYKDKINIPDNPFGIEIEFSEPDFNIVRRKLEKILKYDPAKISWDDKKNNIKDQYLKWTLKNDITVQTHSKENIYLKFGGEVTSPIMKNEKKYWQELELVCETLSKIENIKINSNCSIHIHTEKTIYKYIEEYKNLLKLIMLYEDIIYRVSFGETVKIRNLLTRYAKPMSYYIYERLNELEKIETEKELLKILHYERKFGFNFNNIEENKKQTIENRTGNPTLNKNIIQNYILFNGNLLNYAKIENFDKEFIDYKIKTYEPLFLSESLKEKKEKAKELIELILKDELDQLYILKQYFKIYNENDIEKKHHL